MHRRVDPGQRRRRPRGRLVLAWRRAHLGIMLLWRRRRLPAEEVAARNERVADHQRELEELRCAAEEYHWAVVGERRHGGGVRGG